MEAIFSTQRTMKTEHSLFQNSVAAATMRVFKNGIYRFILVKYVTKHRNISGIKSRPHMN